jgi:hypothetical protein
VVEGCQSGDWRSQGGHGSVEMLTAGMAGAQGKKLARADGATRARECYFRAVTTEDLGPLVLK